MNKSKILDELMEYNQSFVERKEYVSFQTSKSPDKKMVILSCMDTRLTELLPKALNIKNGDAKIIKNAGATITHPFGSILRSIVVAIYEFNARDILVIGHDGCGMSSINPQSVMEQMKNRGITKETLSTLHHAGINVEQWLHGFDSVEESVKESVKSILNHPLVPNDVYVHGLIMNPETGMLRIVKNGYLEE